MLLHQEFDILAGNTVAEKVNAQPALFVQHPFSLIYHNVMLSNLQAKRRVSAKEGGRKAEERKKGRKSRRNFA
jgi:hypothetical protein